MAKITLIFRPNGTMEVQDEPGENAERNLKWLLDNLGQVEKRGHKHGANTRETTKVTLKGG